VEAFDPQAFDVFKMPTITGKESQIVLQRGSGDQEIQIGVNQERDAGHKRGSGRVINERLS
jgi:hypothetical protein